MSIVCLQSFFKNSYRFGTILEEVLTQYVYFGVNYPFIQTIMKVANTKHFS